MHVTEQLALGGLRERRARTKLGRAPDVVQDRCRKQEIGTEPRMKLRRLAAERRHADRVLEQPARIAVMAVRRGRQRAESAANLRVVEEPRDRRTQAPM